MSGNYFIERIQSGARTCGLVMAISHFAQPAYTSDPAGQVRRPVAGVLIGNTKLATANRFSGSVSLIDHDRRLVLSETNIGQSLTDIERLGENQLLVLDHEKHEAVICQIENEQVAVRSRIAVKPYPIDASISANGRWFAVSSLWSRQISIHPIDDDGLEGISVLLPFQPRCVLLIEDHDRIVVSDGFGGKVALLRFAIDPTQKTPSSLSVLSIREVPGHNIRHLSITGKGPDRRLILSQMNINQLSQPLRDEVHWGTYISSSLRSLALNSLLDPNSNLLANSSTIMISDVRRGSADPESFFIDEDDRVVVAIAGTNEVAIFDCFGNPVDRLSVKGGPTQILQIDSSRFATINRFNDSISIFESSSNEAEAQYSLSFNLPIGNQSELSKVQRGEILFHSAKLSHDGWMSCQSCHTDGHTCGQRADTMSDGGVGAAKRVLSLRGVAGTEPLGWNGSLNFDTQIRKSILQTMHGEAIDDRDVADLTVYLQSLTPLPRQSELDESVPTAIKQGEALFKSFGCVKCHAGETKTSPATYQVGLSDSLGNDFFNPPSLRGTLYRDRFFHDNRAESLETLFTKHHHPRKIPMSIEQLGDLIAYLNSL